MKKRGAVLFAAALTALDDCRLFCRRRRGAGAPLARIHFRGHHILILSDGSRAAVAGGNPPEISHAFAMGGRRHPYNE